ncbi:Na+/alanine symporter [uncultured Flavonifractor sp.]|jgi:alanine or glycine:cation symporter, AGCS family|uniref:alanine/glycine:cation symporter family protein n=1 Tax=Eubacteriales TaxID=186802 RepID=UPI0008210F5D|nr:MULTISPECIES: alanine/glycine:cation symporter family protein [Oscillospiraceae]SCH08997.1 Na+/alanine symporter [uncultured Clostridium sp.]SCI48863.1 Na+/alanine symporter [uncultured Flavonifractor sp.]MCH1979613.1 alanine:cation symporter family protein [Lawsonibacter sp. OA9]MCU6703745.1 alanine:cation symporter family protein [Muriventricola aceti]SCJ58325.1 Na+/alanine symporter [uncultured Flavonifractor sp.]
MYDAFAGLISQISGFMYSYLLIVMLLGVGLYFTFRSKFVQLRLLPESIRVVGEKTGDQHSVSAFEALMVSTASRVGTGNIVGVANAIAIGGYGAVFWMWLIAIVGGATAFVESTLAQIYKKKDPEGGSYGGPSYYIQAALKSRVLGVVFAIALIATYAGGFNMLASYNLISSFTSYDFYASAGTFTLGGKEYSVVAVVGGVILAILVAICVLGGGKRIVKVTGVLVPVMGVLYILMALVVMVMNLNMIPSVLGRIFSEAFDFGAMFGGAVGFGSSAIMQGIKRGLYSNEAGVGSAPNAAAAADVSHPVKQGLVQMLSVFIDTILVCTATAMMCLCTGIDIKGGLEGAPLVQASLATTFGAVGPYFITFALLLFAFTTLLGNLFYCEGCLNYIANRKLGSVPMTVFRLIACGLVFVGAQLSFGLVWDLADVLMGIMAIINLPVIVILGRTAMRALQDYMEQRRAGKNPVFKASSIGLKEKTDFWN